jgi:hypothetical protein
MGGTNADRIPTINWTGTSSNIYPVAACANTRPRVPAPLHFFYELGEVFGSKKLVTVFVSLNTRQQARHRGGPVSATPKRKRRERATTGDQKKKGGGKATRFRLALYFFYNSTWPGLDWPGDRPDTARR